MTITEVEHFDHRQVPPTMHWLQGWDTFIYYDGRENKVLQEKKALNKTNIKSFKYEIQIITIIMTKQFLSSPSSCDHVLGTRGRQM